MEIQISGGLQTGRQRYLYITTLKRATAMCALMIKDGL